MYARKALIQIELFTKQFTPLCVSLAITLTACWTSLVVCASYLLGEQPSGANLAQVGDVSYPPCSMIINVTQPPYNAKGDGVTDDTNAIQQALTDMMGKHRMLYFPKGVYLITKTLQWSKKNADGTEAWGKNFLCGENAQDTIIKLKDGVAPDKSVPMSMMWCGGFGSADWFHNYVENLTFDVGASNPAAIGIQFYSNNSGAVRNCKFIASEDSGLVGLDLGHRDMNGPLLVQNCEVTGFERGISTSHAVNGQTFEHITLRNQRVFGFDNAGQAISVRNLLSENAVPAIRSYGVFCLLEAHLQGISGSERWPAVINYNGGKVWLRDVSTQGYARAVGDVVTPDWMAATKLSGEDKLGTLGPSIYEYASQAATTAFPSRETSLRLPILDPPASQIDAPERWANVDTFGADPSGEEDSSTAIQKAIDSGASTVFFPGTYSLKKTVVIRGNVRRLIGLGGMIDYFSNVKPDFRVVDGTAPDVTFEHFAYVHGGIEIDTNRTVIFRSVADCDLTFSATAGEGDLFFEDFVTHNLALTNQHVWARQLNVENEGTHIRNAGGTLWVLGYKTERGGTLLETSSGGSSEILGGFSYTTTAGKLAPMFVTRDSNVFAFFNEVCFNGDPFVTLIEESRGSNTLRIDRKQGHTTPYSSHQR